MMAYESPFSFKVEADQPVVGAAFSWPFKILGTAIVLGCAWWMVQLFPLQQLQSFNQWLTSSAFWSFTAMGVLFYTLWFILTSKTRLDSEVLCQTWMWSRSIRISELSYAKVIRVPGLDWLIAPRIYCRNLTGKLMIIYVADRQLLAQCIRLERELAAVRKF